MTEQEVKQAKLNAFKILPPDIREKVLYNTRVISSFIEFNCATDYPGYRDLNNALNSTRDQRQLGGFGYHNEPRQSRIQKLHVEQYTPYIELAQDLTIDDLIKANIDAGVHEVLQEPKPQV